jgi:hypothetical protein
VIVSKNVCGLDLTSNGQHRAYVGKAASLNDRQPATTNASSSSSSRVATVVAATAAAAVAAEHRFCWQFAGRAAYLFLLLLFQELQASR